MSGLFSRLRPARPAPMAPPAARAPGTPPDLLEAERLAAALPVLSLDTARIAPRSGLGTHGRRQAGHGDSFWQYRPVLPGEPVTRIDWRQSARSERAFVRETEREAAQTVCLWCDPTPSMHWRSDPGLPRKSDRAALLALAAAAMALRAGERARVLGPAGATAATRQRLPVLAAALATLPAHATFPDTAFSDTPRDSLVLLFGDFLDPVELWEHRLRTLIARPAHALLVQVLDPAELELPWQGRVRFEGLEGEPALLVPRAGDLRAAYADAIAAHRAALAGTAARFGARLLLHRTDHPPETALRTLHLALSGAPAIGGPGPQSPAGAGQRPA